MKYFLLFLTLFLLATAPAYACPPFQGTSPDVDMNIVDHFGKLADSMGVGCAAYYTRSNPQSFLLEYVADDETLDNWTKMMTVNFLDTGKADAATATLPMTEAFIKRIESIGGKAEIIATTDTKNVSDTQHGLWYTVKYAVGTGSTHENSVVIMRTVGPKRAAFIHFQQRTEDLADHTIQTFMSLNGIQ